MELKTFAVRQMLLKDDPLLRYVVKEEPIPVSVVASSFHDFIAPLADEKSEGLISDYPKMLNENVPLVVQTNAEGGYDISGNIPDTLLEAITLVHNVDQEKIVRALAEYNLKTVHGQSCSIVDATLQDTARRTLMAMESIPSVIPVGTGSQKPDGAELLGFEGTDAGQAEEGMGMLAAEGLDNALEETLAAEELAEAYEEPYGPVQEAVAATEELAGASEGVEMAPVIAEPSEPAPETMPAAEKPEDEAVFEEKPADSFAQSIRNIYRKFCADLHSFGLDDRLGLSLA